MLLFSLQISLSGYLLPGFQGATTSPLAGLRIYRTPLAPAPGRAVGRVPTVRRVFVAFFLRRSRTSSTPAFAEKNAVCSSRKFALVFVSVLERMIIPAVIAEMRSKAIKAAIRATPCSRFFFL